MGRWLFKKNGYKILDNFLKKIVGKNDFNLPTTYFLQHEEPSYQHKSKKNTI